MIRLVAASLALMAAACTTAPQTYRQLDRAVDNYAAAQPGTADEATERDTCGAARFSHLIGAPADAIDQSTLPPRTRIIAPESMVTQDFVPARLNIFTDTDGKVSSMRCF